MSASASAPASPAALSERPDARGPLGTAACTLLLARTHWRVLLQRGRISFHENRLMTLTILGFLAVYASAAYFLVLRGLSYVHRLPLLGPLLTERMVYVMFFFFFVMLVISNATITGMGMFRKRETGWQVATPIPFRSLVLWKTIEGMVLASWGLMVLSAPILLAIGSVLEATWSFYVASVPALLCLVTIAANVSSWLLLALVRWARRWWRYPLIAIVAIGIVWVVFNLWFVTPKAAQLNDLAANVNQVMRHTEICAHPLLPSSWVSDAIMESERGFNRRSWFFTLLLISNALCSLVITNHLAGRWFYAAWNRVMSADFVRTPSRSADSTDQLSGPPARWKLRLLGVDRGSYALLMKDVKTFAREPVQWGQSALIFGLLFFYMSNLQRLGYDVASPLWSTVLSYLNLLVCALALSTLTTRFVFPQFSMEGRRMWILGPSPVPVEKTLSLKLKLGGGVMAVLTAPLMLISSITIGLSWHRTVYFCSSIVLMSFGLSALALALGALIPNFKESNPARIVSGFGGTMCLISSFIYILISLTVLLAPALLELKPEWVGVGRITPAMRIRWESLSFATVCLNTIIFGFIPYYFARKNIKSLEYLRHLN